MEGGTVCLALGRMSNGPESFFYWCVRTSNSVENKSRRWQLQGLNDTLSRGHGRGFARCQLMECPVMRCMCVLAHVCANLVLPQPVQAVRYKCAMTTNQRRLRIGAEHRRPCCVCRLADGDHEITSNSGASATQSAGWCCGGCLYIPRASRALVLFWPFCAVVAANVC